MHDGTIQYTVYVIVQGNAEIDSFLTGAQMFYV